ncbi:4Fe-4S dicluster domain-containing protein [Immundisolibacter sp.]|uniref:4Fe-4S dicluster domain-containing protein n=1 Tax=Immundisolibacter sp. TaxID=1934948 RepID=UPI0035649D59
MSLQYGMFVDVERCIGCQACSVACKIENDPPLGKSFMNVKTLGGAHTDTPSGTYPNVKMTWEPTLCMHCRDAPCLNVCPTQALSRRPDGIVVLNEDECLGQGCRRCTFVCPYGVIEFNEAENVMQKCNFCTQRVDAGQTTACAEACVYEAIFFGDLNDPDSDVSRAIERAGGQTRVMGPEHNTDPVVYYSIG